MKHKLFGYAFSLLVAVLAYSSLLAPTAYAAPVPKYQVDDSEVITATGGAVDVVTGMTGHTVTLGNPEAGNIITLRIPGASSVCSGTGAAFTATFDIIRAGSADAEYWAIRSVAGIGCEGGTQTDNDVFDESSWFTPGRDGYMRISDTITPPSQPPSTPDLGDPRFSFWSAKSKDAEYIRACGGIFDQFTPQATGNCLEFVNTKDSDQTNLVWKSADAVVANKSAAGCSGVGPARFTFELTLIQPTNIIEEETSSGATRYGLPGNVSISGSHPDCANLQLNDMGGGGSMSTTVWGAHDIDSIMGQPVEGIGESQNSLCEVTGGLSWILCPIMNTVASINEEAYNLIEHFLKIPPMMTDGSGSGAYEVWKMIRNLANVLFAIVFIVIIYSQLTSAGINNYGIKKMLPKLLVGIILVNTSYWIVALGVDLSNVIGSTIYNVMDNMAREAGPSEGAPGWGSITAGTLTGALLGGAAFVMAGVSVLLPMLVSALFMIVGLVFVLTFRHALVFILAVLAPLAIVAYLLPNTEGLFKSWAKMLRVLLYIYPAVGFIMGASNVAAMIVFAAAQDAEGMAKFVMMLIAVGMPAMAIFAALMIAQTMGKVGGKLGLANPFGGMINAAKERAGAMGRNADGRMSQNRLAGRIGGIGQSRRTARDYKQQMADDKYGSHAKARVLRSKRGNAAFVAQGAAQQSFNQAQTKAQIDELKTNKELHVDAVVENMRLEAAQSQQTELVSSLAATGAGEAGAAAKQAREDKYVSELANSSNERMVTSANAEAILSGGRASEAAGADINFGEQRARAYADQTIDKQTAENVAAERSLLGSTSDEELERRINNPAGQSTEAYMAAAGEIASRGYMGGKLELMRSLNSQMKTHKDRIRTANPRTSGETDKQYKERIDQLTIEDDGAKQITMAQKQAMGDMKDAPFGVGDSMRGAWNRGVGEEDFDTSFNERIISHLNPGYAASLKSEEVNYIHDVIEAGPGGTLGAQGYRDAVASLEATISSLNADTSPHRGSMKPGLRKKINELQASGHLSQAIRLD